MAVLLKIADSGEVSAGDVKDLLPGSSAVRSKQLKRLLDRDMLYRTVGTSK